MLPVMLARGYHPTMATGPIMAIGAVDMLIPPSALTVLLGSLSGISISKLLLGGVVPGLLLSVAFVAWIIVRVRISPHLAPTDTDAVEHQGWDRWQPLFAYVLPTLSIFGVVVGALAAGWATPTECAALGAFATMLLAALYRALRWEAVLKALKGTAGISGMILFIILGATTFAQIITEQGLSANQILIGMMVFLIFLGIFVDQVSMMMITLPIFMPIVNALGIDPVWFGVLFLICMQMGLLLPPHGLLLMTMRGVAPPSVTMTHIFLAVTPYLVMSVLLLVAVFMVPGIATWLPSWMG
jgi:tripartite ATP-independent transporter DctM subunit